MKTMLSHNLIKIRMCVYSVNNDNCIYSGDVLPRGNDHTSHTGPSIGRELRPIFNIKILGFTGTQR